MKENLEKKVNEICIWKEVEKELIDTSKEHPKYKNCSGCEGYDSGCPNYRKLNLYQIVR